MTTKRSSINAAKTLTEVAEIMTSRGYPMSKQAALDIEQRAIRKLRNDPLMRRLFLELTAS